MKRLTIGEVAARTGLRTSALRYYESEELLPIAERRGGKRVYAEEVLDRLALIDAGRRAGLRISELRHLTGQMERSTPPSASWPSVAARKRVELEERLAELRSMQATLEQLARCSCTTIEECAGKLRAASAKSPA
jgi:MerR family transcriptional regulator, redox-sensitive transcriptional activator SoxR